MLESYALSVIIQKLNPTFSIDEEEKPIFKE